MHRTNKILLVINEARNRKNAELNAQIKAALLLPTAEQIAAMPIFTRLGIKAITSTWKSTITLIGPSTLEVAYSPRTHNLYLDEDGQRGADMFNGINIQLRDIDFVDLLTNPYHRVKRDLRPNYSRGQNTELDVNDLLNIQARERRDLVWNGEYDPAYNRRGSAIGAKQVLQQAEQRTGLNFNPDGKQRVIRKK